MKPSTASVPARILMGCVDVVALVGHFERDRVDNAPALDATKQKTNFLQLSRSFAKQI